MRDDSELRLMALEMVVGELVRRLAPGGFREGVMNSMDLCVGKLCDITEGDREDFVVFRRHVHEILYGKPPQGSQPADAAPSWIPPVLKAVGRK